MLASLGLSKPNIQQVWRCLRRNQEEQSWFHLYHISIYNRLRGEFWRDDVTLPWYLMNHFIWMNREAKGDPPHVPLPLCYGRDPGAAWRQTAADSRSGARLLQPVSAFRTNVTTADKRIDTARPHLMPISSENSAQLSFYIANRLCQAPSYVPAVNSESLSNARELFTIWAGTRARWSRVCVSVLKYGWCSHRHCA